MVVVEGVCYPWRLILYIFKQVRTDSIKLKLFNVLLVFLVGFGGDDSVEKWTVNVLYLTTQPPHSQSM